MAVCTSDAVFGHRPTYLKMQMPTTNENIAPKSKREEFEFEFKPKPMSATNAKR
jgi:hypothetical protein